MKILVLISNYGSNQTHFCFNLINELNNIKNYFFDIKVFSNQKNNFDNCEEYVSNSYSGNEFPRVIYDFLKNFDFLSYDYILFTENDLIFTEENFETFFKYQKLIDENEYSVGFWRYEFKNQSKFLIDLGYDDRKISFLDRKVFLGLDNNNLFFKTLAVHQGCWFFKSNILKKLLESISIGHTLEDKVSNFYYSQNWPGTTNGIKQVLPFSEFEKLLIHHQPNKYVNLYRDLPSVENLINERNLIIENNYENL